MSNFGSNWTVNPSLEAKNMSTKFSLILQNKDFQEEFQLNAGIRHNFLILRGYSYLSVVLNCLSIFSFQLNFFVKLDFANARAKILLHLSLL